MVFFPKAYFIHFFTKVEGCLPAHSRQYRINLVFFQNLFNAFDSKGQEIYFIRYDGVGHYGSRIRVDEDGFDTLLAKTTSSLRARIIELASLTDNDGARANDKYTFD